MTEGAEEGDGNGSSGSESDPSEDNLEEDEIAKIVPLKPNKKKGTEKKKGLPEVKPPKKEVLPVSAKKDPRASSKLPQKSPVKKIL